MTEKQETRIAILENNHVNVMEKFSDITKRLDNMDKKLDKVLEKKANKWVETGFVWFISVAGVAIIGIIIRFILLLKI